MGLVCVDVALSLFISAHAGFSSSSSSISSGLCFYFAVETGCMCCCFRCPVLLPQAEEIGRLVHVLSSSKIGAATDTGSGFLICSSRLLVPRYLVLASSPPMFLPVTLRHYFAKV